MTSFKAGDRVKLVEYDPIYDCHLDEKILGQEWILESVNSDFTAFRKDGKEESGHHIWNCIDDKGNKKRFGDLIFELVSNKTSGRLDCVCSNQELVVCGCKCGAFKKQLEHEDY